MTDKPLFVLDTTEVYGNSGSASLSYSADVRMDKWKLRDFLVGSKSKDGYRWSELEMLSGARVLVGPAGKELVKVPLNNDDLWETVPSVYRITTVSIQATMVESTIAVSLQKLAKTDQEYYVKYNALLLQLNDPLISYELRKEAAISFEKHVNQKGKNVKLANSGFSLENCRFAESGGLEIAHLVNGPYADIKVTVVSRTLIDLQGE